MNSGRGAHGLFHRITFQIVSSLSRSLATKYRHKVLEGAIREPIREVIGQACAEMGVHIVKGVLARCISVPPQIAVSKVMRRIKERASRRVQMGFPEPRKRFWARGYFSTTLGKVTDDIVLSYLELHYKRDATGACR